jgi:ketosteroid isomerase-like protein
MQRGIFSVAMLAFMGLLAAATAQAQTSKTDRAADKAAAEQTFRDYAATFMTGDLKKVMAYYNESMMLMPAARIMTLAEADPFMEKVREDRRSRGVVEGVLERLDVKLVGDGVALVSFIIRQQTKDGTVVQASAGTYYLRKADNGWKIAVMHVFPTSDYVKLD